MNARPLKKLYRVGSTIAAAVHHLATPSLVAICLVAGILSCAGQGGVTAPLIRDLSVTQGTSTKRLNMWLSTQLGVNYAAEYKNQLIPGSWLPLTNFSGTGGSDMIADAVGDGAGRFYRVFADARPWIRSQPHSRNAQSGETIQLDVIATGMLPLAYQWYGPGGIVTNGGRFSGSTTANLLISNLDPGDQGNYWVAITNLYGSTSCVPAGVRISVSQAPRILIDPQSQALLVGQALSLWSTASGVQPLYFKWYGPAGLMVDSGRTGGSTTTNLSVSDLQVIDDGPYFMVVSNSFGMATSTVATVRVQLGQAPRISTDPASQTIIGGQTANLSVVATGTGTLSYAWHGPSGIISNGGKYSGATTANLSISNFQATENGDYYVVVSNSFGNATSGTANLRAQ